MPVVFGINVVMVSKKASYDFRKGKICHSFREMDKNELFDTVRYRIKSVSSGN